MLQRNVTMHASHKLIAWVRFLIFQWSRFVFSHVATLPVSIVSEYDGGNPGSSEINCSNSSLSSSRWLPSCTWLSWCRCRYHHRDQLDSISTVGRVARWTQGGQAKVIRVPHFEHWYCHENTIFRKDPWNCMSVKISQSILISGWHNLYYERLIINLSW